MIKFLNKKINKIKTISVVVFIVVLGLLLGSDLFSTPTASAAWYTSGGTWTNRKRIAINPKKVINSNGTAVAGSTSTGTADNTSVANRMYLVPITVSNTGTITDLQVRTDSTASFNNPRFKGIITDASFNILTNGTTGIVTVSGTDPQSWYTATFATPPSVTSGTTYYVGFVAEDANLYYRTTATAGAYYHANSFASPTNPTSPTSSTDYVSVYANVAYVQTITNFPMLFSVTDSELRFTDSGGLVASSTGGDILFASGDGSTLLNFEIEKYASTTGELVAWVNIPFISSTSTVPIYMYYGNASAPNNQNPTAVWDANYKAVYHLKDGTTLNLTDSTSNAKNGTNNAGVTAGTGKIDGAASFNNASSQYVSLPSSTLGAGSVTVELWTKFTTFTGYWPMFSAHTSDADSMEIFVDNTSQLFGGNYNNRALTSSGLNTGQWYYVVLTAVSGGVTQFYINGVASGSTGTTNFATYTVAPNIGRRATYYYNNIIDEVRLSSGIARSADWIKTQYNNQSDPATFYAYEGSEYQNRIGPAEKVRGGGTVNLTNPAVKVRGGVKFR